MWCSEHIRCPLASKLSSVPRSPKRRLEYGVMTTHDTMIVNQITVKRHVRIILIRQELQIVVCMHT